MLDWILRTVEASSSGASNANASFFGTFTVSEYFTLLLSGLISFLVSYVMQWYFGRPKVRAYFINMSIGTMNIGDIQRTLFAPYVYITNHRHNSVTILNYEMEIDFGDGFVKLGRLYGLQMNWPEPFEGQTETDIIRIPKFKDKLIYANPATVSFGEIIKGFLAFVDEPSTRDLKVRRIKLTCIDALQKRHVTISSPEKYPPIYLFYDLVGANVIRKSEQM